MQISKNFTLEEFSQSHTAEMAGIDNVPGEREVSNIKALVHNVLQPLRDITGFPVVVTSGYRSPALNRKIGGAENSQHTKGEAADIIALSNWQLFHVIKETGEITFDQLIWEFGNDEEPAWVHVSYRANGHNRGEVLRAYKHNGQTKYMKP